MKPEEKKAEAFYSEEIDPYTPYLNPEYRIDLYENTCEDIELIILAIFGVILGILAYFLIFFVPIASGIPYHKHMWWVFLIILILTLAVRLNLSVGNCGNGCVG